MIFQQANRSDPEVVYGVYKNNEGGSLPIGAVACLDNTAGNVNGNNIVQCNSGGLGLAVGLMAQTLADQAFGKVVLYGYFASAVVVVTDTSFVTGLVLAPVAGQNYLSTVSADNQSIGRFNLLQSTTTGTGTVALKVFVHCM